MSAAMPTKGARMTRLCLGKVAVAAVLLLASLGLFMACNGSGNGHSSGADPGEKEAEATKVEQQREIMRGFLGAYPVKSYASFEEAEQVAGYHIPRASAEYPVAFGETTLQWFPQFDRPKSETQYIFPPVGDTPISVGVRVAPSYFYPKGDETATSGKPMTVGGKTGWMLREDIAWVFVFDCGSVDDVKVWCQVTGVKEIGWEAFDHFVSTLQWPAAASAFGESILRRSNGTRQRPRRV